MSIFENVFGQVDYGDALNNATGIGGHLGSAQNMTPADYHRMMSQQLADKQQAYNMAEQRRVQVAPKKAPVRFNPNDHEAYVIPLSQLVTMWQIKFGDKWVEAMADKDSDFFVDAADRLSRANMLEEVRGWIRLKEGV